MESDTVVPVFVKRTENNSIDMSSAIDLYYFPMSPPVRAVLLLAKALGIAFNLKMVNIMAGEQMKPEYLKMNPMHTVPTLDDNGFVLWESRAILEYLVDQYDKSGRFKVKDAKNKALVNQFLFFESGTVMPTLIKFMAPVLFEGVKPDAGKKAEVEKIISVIDGMIQGRKYIAGDALTIADFSMIATLSTAEAVSMDMTKFPNVEKWMKLCKKEMEGYDEINQKPAETFAELFKQKTSG